MRGISLALNRSGVPFRAYWGFDSFAGLPEEGADDKGALTPEAAAGWKNGNFNVADALQTWSYGALERKLRQYIADPRVRFVRGFFNESLTPQLAAAAGMRPAAFVEIDCDLRAPRGAKGGTGGSLLGATAAQPRPARASASARDAPLGPFARHLRLAGTSRRGRRSSGSRRVGSSCPARSWVTTTGRRAARRAASSRRTASGRRGAACGCGRSRA